VQLERGLLKRDGAVTVTAQLVTTRRVHVQRRGLEQDADVSGCSHLPTGPIESHEGMVYLDPKGLWLASALAFALFVQSFRGVRWEI
jgi:hypothetical protein